MVCGVKILKYNCSSFNFSFKMYLSKTKNLRCMGVPKIVFTTEATAALATSDCNKLPL